MGAALKVLFAAAIAASFTFCLAGLVVAALGWPFFIAGVFTGAGGGAAAVRAWQRARAADQPDAPGA